MSETEILTAAREFGKARDAAGFASLAEAHRFVSSSRNSRRNAGKVEFVKIARAYADGLRVAHGMEG